MASPECELTKTCPFFNDKMPDDKGLGHMYKKQYCLGGWHSCARYMIFKELGRESVPPKLYPNQKDLARLVLSQGHKES